MKALLGAMTLTIALCAGVAADDTQVSGVAEGKVLAERLCARCHAIGADGDSPFKEAPPFRTFGEKWPIDSLAEAFAEGIVVGHPDMPEFQFEVDQIDALLVYLESLQDG